MKFVIIILALVFSTLTFAKSSAFIRTTGSKQGLFKGESTARGREQFAEILSYTFEILSPRDPSSGQPTGKRQLRPITIVKDWGASSNQYFTAIATNEVLKEVRIDFYSNDVRSGQEVLERSVVLNNAFVIDAKDSTTVVNGDLQDSQTITFNYSKITITDKTGTIFTDDLNQP